MTRIVTSHYRTKRPPRKRAKAAPGAASSAYWPMTPDFERGWKHYIEEDTLDDFRGKLVICRVRIGDLRTTVRLTPLTWRLLQEIAQRSAATVHELCTTISSEKPRTMPLTVAIRAVVLRYYLDSRAVQVTQSRR